MLKWATTNHVFYITITYGTESNLSVLAFVWCWDERLYTSAKLGPPFNHLIILCSHPVVDRVVQFKLSKSSWSFLQWDSNNLHYKKFEGLICKHYMYIFCEGIQDISDGKCALVPGVMSNHSIDHAEWMFSCLSWWMISTLCVILV